MRKFFIGVAAIAVILTIAFVLLRAPDAPAAHEAPDEGTGAKVETAPIGPPPVLANEPVAVAPPPEPPPSLHIEIVIDTSESMNEAFDGKTKLAAAVAALRPVPYFEND